MFYNLISLTRRLIGVLLLFVSVQGLAQDFSRWEAEIRKLEKSADGKCPKKKAIVFTGSSSIRNWRSLKEDFPDHCVLNMGFGGSETDAVTYYANRIIFPFKPHQVVIYVGENDIAGGKSVEKVFSDLKILFQKIRKELPKTSILFISVKPSPSRMKYLASVQELNRKVEDYLTSMKRATYIDVFSKMMVMGRANPGIFVSDSLHMNKAGYKLWTVEVGPYLKK